MVSYARVGLDLVQKGERARRYAAARLKNSIQNPRACAHEQTHAHPSRMRTGPHGYTLHSYN